MFKHQSYPCPALVQRYKQLPSYRKGTVNIFQRFSSILLLIGCLANLSSADASACAGIDQIALKQPVVLSESARAQLQQLPPLRIVSINAPPMAFYNKKTGTYSGIAVDVLCFIAQEIGLELEFIHAEGYTLKERINLIAEGAADIFMPLSLLPDRAAHGLFTDIYFENYYAVIGREDETITVTGLMDLRAYQVGVVAGTSFTALLQDLLPLGNLHEFKDSTGINGLFSALRRGEIDVAVYNKSVFSEERYQFDLFDLIILDTLYEEPRAYRFYVHDTPIHRQLVQAINQYLAVIDTTESAQAHHSGEQQFIERYVTQRSQRVIMFIIIGVGAVMLLAFYLVSHRYRRLMALLERRNEHIRQQREALKKANAELAALTHTDELTRLANRRLFNDTLAREYARWKRTETPLSLLVADTDFFKLVNDHFGHLTGDDYLRAIARVLESSVQRGTDLVARPGGEEFACVLPDTSIYDARLIAQRIQRGLAKIALPNPLAENPVLTISIGIATLVSGDYSIDDLLSHADRQMYHVKRTGRNNISWVELTRDGPRKPV